MNEWLKRNWKWLLAAVAGSLIVILLFMLRRGRGTASQISFPSNPILGGGDQGPPPPAPGPAPPPTGGVQAWIRPLGALGPDITNAWDQVYGGIPVRDFPGSHSGGQWGNILQFLQWGQAVNLLRSIQGADPLGGRNTTWWEFQLPDGEIGYIWSGDLQFRNPNVSSSGSFSPVPIGLTQPFGAGGPAPADRHAYSNLGLISLQAQRLYHLSAGRSPRQAAAALHQAAQASRERVRMLQPARGMAPVIGPGRLLRHR